MDFIWTALPINLLKGVNAASSTEPSPARDGLQLSFSCDVTRKPHTYKVTISNEWVATVHVSVNYSVFRIIYVRVYIFYTFAVFCRYPNYRFLYNTTLINLAQKSRYSQDGIAGIRLDIYLLSKCDFLVCTMSSNVSIK